MSRRTNVINSVITMVAAIAAAMVLIIVCNNNYIATMGEVLSIVIIATIVVGFIVTVFHELTHLIAGKINGFAFVSLTVLFFRWHKSGKKIYFDFVKMGDAAGNTEMVSKSTERLAERFKKMTFAPMWTTLFLTLVGIIPFFFAGEMPLWLYLSIGMFLPIGVYSFCANALPVSSCGVRNDGAIVYGLKKQDDESKVILALLSLQSEMYNGKTPCEIDKSLYFDLPQIQEDSLNFILLLNARYAYYVDGEDYENAKKVSDRLETLIDYMPKPVAAVIKTDLLYNACTFDFNAARADELTYELEKFLNAVNTSENIRAKLAYILYVKKETTGLSDFYNKGVKEANRNPIKGICAYEKKLLLKMKEDVLQAEGITEQQ